MLGLDKSNWTTVRFGDVADRVREQIPYGTGEVTRYVAGGHFDDSMRITRWGEPADGGMGSTFTYCFRPGDVLYVSASWYLRKVAVATFEGVTADKTYVMRPRDESVLSPRFLPWILKSDSLHGYASRRSTGSMNVRLLWTALAGFEFTLPDIDEQERIADLLWAIESHQRVLEAQLTCWGEGLRQWRDRWFQREGAERLDAFFSVQLGRQRAPQHAHGEHMRPYLRSANLTGGEVSLNDVKEMNFTPQEQAQFRLEPGDVLISEGCGTLRELGTSARWSGEQEMYFQKTLIRLRPKGGGVTGRMAEQWAIWAKDSGAFRSIARGTGMYHLTAVRCAGLPFPRFDQDDVSRFTAEVEQIERGTSALEEERLALAALRKSLLDGVFMAVAS